MSLAWLRRGAGIIAGCAIGCVAVALAIAAILPDRFSAEAVLIVPSSPTASLGSVDQAAKLAGTYAQLIPKDTAILSAIGSNLEMPPAAVEQRLRVELTPGQSLLSLTFRGRSAAEALRGARRAALTITSDDFTSDSIQAGSMSIVRLPRVATLTGRKPFTHAAQSVLFVPPTPTVGGPGNAGEAANLATTYADLIPEDRVILQHVADRVGRDLDTVRAGLSVTHDFDTSILRISFSDHDPKVALSGAQVLADSVTGGRPISTRVAPRSLSIVHVPTTAVGQAMSHEKVVVLGLMFGLTLGLVLVLARERTHRRIDDLETLSAEVGSAASSLAAASDASIAALLDRWHGIAGKTPTRVALLAGSPTSEDAAVDVAERLAPDAVQDRRVASTNAPRKTRDGKVVLEIGGTPGGTAAGERLALGADLVVLVVRQGALLADVSETLAVLETFGVSPNWAILVSSGESPSRESAPVAVDSHRSLRRKETRPRKRSATLEEPPVPVVKIAPAARLGHKAKQPRVRTLGAREQDDDTPAHAADQA
jgi:capsular polysaccharide biosynthesis protein